VPEADVLETKAAIKSMLQDSELPVTNRTVTTKPTIAYGTAAGLGQFPYLVSLQYVLYFKHISNSNHLVPPLFIPPLPIKL
jgi:hypothetical protein